MEDGGDFEKGEPRLAIVAGLSWTVSNFSWTSRDIEVTILLSAVINLKGTFVGKHSTGAQIRRSRTPRIQKTLGITISSFMAGFGFSALANPGPAAQASNINVPVVSTVTNIDEVPAAVPTGLAANASASNIAALREARASVVDFEAGADQCEPVQSSSLTAAMMTPVESTQVISPMATGTYRISSTYGYRSDPFMGTPKFHAGVDFAAPTDTPIYSIADGEVVYAGNGDGVRAGGTIIIKHETDSGVFWSYYVHMWANGIYVNTGDTVSAGDKIAGVGNSGRSTGPHLHFEIHVDSQENTVDPLQFLDQQGAVDLSELC